MHFVFSYFFLILISTPLLFDLFGKDISLNLIWENRVLANTPKFNVLLLKDQPKLWDQYFKDRMPFRQVFMPGYIFLYEKILKTYVSEYITGKGNELFMNHASPVFDAAVGISPFTDQWKEHARLTAAGKHAYFLSKGIHYYLFLVPDKTTLYPELLPFYTTWIHHKTWYDEQTATIQKANINFFPMNDYLSKFKNQERLYDIIYDNCHWNGNSLALAYKYIAKILAKDNHIFEPVALNEYYELTDMPVTLSVYGSEKTKFINLKHTENFSCSVLADEYRTLDYNKLCINNKKLTGSIWLVSDSYFGGTHGSSAVTPFIHSVHTYIHRHVVIVNNIFTHLADVTLQFNKPDAVVEEFVERGGGGTQDSLYDPKLRILGDYWMKTGGIFLDHKTDLSVFSFRNVALNDSTSNKLDIKADNLLTLKAPVAADDLGRVVVMGKLNTPANTAVKIFYRDETGTEKTLDFGIAQGSQLFHETIHVKPFSKVNLSLQFLTPGKYRLEKIQEIDDLRERM